MQLILFSDLGDSFHPLHLLLLLLFRIGERRGLRKMGGRGWERGGCGCGICGRELNGVGGCGMREGIEMGVKWLG